MRMNSSSCGRGLHRVHHEHQEVGGARGLQGAAGHDAVQAFRTCGVAAGVHQPDPGSRQGAFHFDRVPRNARLGMRYGPAAPDQDVEESRFSDVGPAENGDERTLRGS